MSRKLTRRSFLKNTALAGAAASLSARTYSQAPGSNEDIRIAVIGFNGRGQNHINAWTSIKGVRIVALCDVDSKVLDKGVNQLLQKNLEVKPYKDIRQLLQSNEVDAVSIATPNHWHSLAAIWAIQAGKDVYVEKPVSHNVWEGRQLVKAADQYKKIVQMGVQSRSAKGLANVLEWLKTEPLGKLKYARGLCYKRRPSIGLVAGDQQVPATVDYDLWCGPAPLVQSHRNDPKYGTLHYAWHWFWDYGNGDLGNQGIHQMDIARRFTGETELSPKVFSIGGRLGYKDNGETPNSQIVFHDYEKAPIIFEVRGLPDKTDGKEMDKYRGASVGVVVQYENGYVVAPDYENAAVFGNDDKLIRKFGNPSVAKGMVESDPAPASEKKPAEPDDEKGHFANFLKGVRSRKVSDLNGKIIDGHISSALCHTGNISYRLGKTASPGEMREKLKGNKDALDSFDRLATHLEANGVDIKVDKLAMGEFLKFDPKTEQFIGNKAADKMLTREYRAPYIVPEKV